MVDGDANKVKKITGMSGESKKQCITLSFIVSIVIIYFAGTQFFSTWSITTLNDELQIEVFAPIEDENTTLTVRPATIIPIDHYIPVDDENQTITSDYGVQIQITRNSPGWNLNICYVEILVDNGVSDESLDGWSLRFTAGYLDGHGMASSYSINVPPHSPATVITFQVNLLSTESTQTGITFATPTNINGKNFTLAIGYGEEDISADLSERSTVAGNSLLFWILAWSAVILWHLCPEPKEEPPKLARAEKLDVLQAASWIRYIGSRIDYLEEQRHNLIVEAEILLVILGAIASYSLIQDFNSALIIIAVLATPLLISIIYMMLGSESDYSAELATTNPESILDQLRIQLSSSMNLIRQGKKGIALGSFYAIEISILLLFIPIGQSQLIPLGLLAGAITLAFLLNLYLLTILVMRKTKENVAETTTGEEYFQRLKSSKS